MELLCKSKNAVEVVYDPDASHVATHFADSPNLKALVKTAIEATEITSSELFFEHAFPHVIGTTDLVSTDETDEIIFAKRLHRDIYTRFTKSRQPEDCATVTIALKRITDGRYLLWSAWIGYIGPAFPGDANETPDSIAYWSSHALIWGRQDVQQDTITTTMPWQDEC